VEGKEALKYGNVKFQPTKEPATRQVNCAGYVLAKLLPGQIPPSIVVTTDFYNKFIVPFKQPSGTIKVISGKDFTVIE
jgi:hypothetical protein